jgi:hypothetical protein
MSTIPNLRTQIVQIRRTYHDDGSCIAVKSYSIRSLRGDVKMACTEAEVARRLNLPAVVVFGGSYFSSLPWLYSLTVSLPGLAVEEDM